MEAAARDSYCNSDTLLRLVQGVSGAPQQSQQALDRITRCYGDRLLRAGQRYCRTQAEAEDAVQETLLHALLHLDDFRAEGSLEGWLVRIVASACRRQARGQRNDASRHTTNHELASSGPSPFAATCTSELSRALADALLELSNTDRLVLLLAEAEGWRSEEIAAELGLTAGAVRVRLTRLRARLRKSLSHVLPDS